MPSPDSNAGAQPTDAIRIQLEEARAARKCFGCGCLHKTVEALEGTDLGRGPLAPDLARTRAVFVPKAYDCLGCTVCYPAIAANVYAEAFPAEGASLDLCPTESPEERLGWPPLPGDFQVVRYDAPVAVCGLNSGELVEDLAREAPAGLSIAGTLHTENLGIERIIRNVLGNPHLRRLVVCGEDTQQAIGHLPGRSLLSLFAAGIDENGRIRDAPGKRPVLKNVSPAQVEVFRRQVQVVPMIGVTDRVAVVRAIEESAASAPGFFEEAPPDLRVPTIHAVEPTRLIPDPAGYCIVYPDRMRRMLRLEHFQNDGALNCVIEGPTPAAILATLVEQKLVSRLDHAGYLGRELARAEHTLATGDPYTQDRAPGDTPVVQPASCGCAEPTEDSCRTSSS